MNFIWETISSVGSDTQKAVKSSFWVFLFRAGTRTISLIRTVVLARLLIPRDFGVFGIAMLTVSGLETVSKTGFDQALIQKHEKQETYLNAAWTMNILRGIVLTVFIFTISPLIADFFAEPNAERYLKLLSLWFLIRGVINIGILNYQMELEYQKRYFLEILASLGGLTASVATAFVVESPLALVVGALSESMILLLTSYIIHPYRPTLEWNFKKWKELFSFGKWVTSSSLMLFLLTEGDDVFVGKMVGAASLGIYQLGYRISNLPATEIMRMGNQIVFPGLSKVKDDLEKLRYSFFQAYSLISVTTFLVSCLIILLARDFTHVFLGKNWDQVIPIIQILAVWGAIRALGSSTNPVFMALGKPEWVTVFQAMMLGGLIVFIYPLTVGWGIQGTSLAVVLSSLILPWFQYPKLRKILECEAWQLYRLILFPLVAASLTGISFVFIQKGIGSAADVSLGGLLLKGALISTSYLMLIIAFSSTTLYEGWKNVKFVIRTLLSKAA